MGYGNFFGGRGVWMVFIASTIWTEEIMGDIYTSVCIFALVKLLNDLTRVHI